MKDYRVGTTKPFLDRDDCKYMIPAIGWTRLFMNLNQDGAKVDPMQQSLATNRFVASAHTSSF